MKNLHETEFVEVLAKLPNIKEFNMTVVEMEFYNKILNHIISTDKDAHIYEFTDNDVARIKQLANEKYKTGNFEETISLISNCIENDFDDKRVLRKVDKTKGETGKC